MESVIEKVKSFSLHDGEIRKFTYDGDCLVVDFLNWKEEQYQIVFHDAVWVKACIWGSVLESEIVIKSPEIDFAKQYLGYFDDDRRFRDFIHLKLIDEGPMLEVVFLDFSIENI